MIPTYRLARFFIFRCWKCSRVVTTRIMILSKRPWPGTTNLKDRLVPTPFRRRISGEYASEQGQDRAFSSSQICNLLHLCLEDWVELRLYGAVSFIKPEACTRGPVFLQTKFASKELAVEQLHTLILLDIGTKLAWVAAPQVRASRSAMALLPSSLRMQGDGILNDTY